VSPRPRYGVDGWPYLLGLSATALSLLPTGAALLARGRTRSGTAALAVGAVAAVPAGLGARYVLVGKARLRDRLLNAVAWRGDEDVVDLGCGAGLLALGAAQRTAGTVHAVDRWVGKDLSGNRESRLRRNAELLGVASRVVVHTADVRSTGLADASVDVVLSALCVHNLGSPADRWAALAEAVRVLRPGGSLVISDLAHVEDEYAPALRQLGLQVRTARVPASFPPQRCLVAHRPV
jgi:SAM-dependent methyltransferase